MKPRLHLVPLAALEEATKAFEDGIAKHGGEYNWRLGTSTITINNIVDKIMRHALALSNGEDVASDSGISHLGHIIADAAIALDVKSLGLLVDDRILKK